MEEFDCYGKAFYFLYKLLTPGEFVKPKPLSAIKEGVEQAKKYTQWDINNSKYSIAKHPRIHVEQEPEDTEINGRWEEENPFPVMFIITGSNCPLMKVRQKK